MSTKNKPVCETGLKWLKDNLGPRCLAGLTGQDIKALTAAIHIVELWTYTDNSAAAEQAFGLCVRSMQESQWQFAYHVIAHVAEWSSRAELWSAAGLPPISVSLCAWEPGGRMRPLPKSPLAAAAA